MHIAPSVNFPVRPSRTVDAASIVFWLAGIAALGAWRYHQDGDDWRTALVCAAFLIHTGGLIWVLRRPANGTLRWDGAEWSFESAAGRLAGTAAVHLDFQFLILVRFTQGRAANWFWLTRRCCPELWSEVRRALYARVAAGRPDDGAREAASPTPSKAVAAVSAKGNRA